MSEPRIRKVAVIGAGTMGHGIGQVFAQAGYDVTLEDLTDDILNKALARIAANLDTFIEHGLATEQDRQQTLSRIRVTTSLAEAVREADFVTEAIPENLELKRQLFCDMERLCPEHAILASNTSGLRITQIGSACARQENLVITHWFNPPHIVPLVEIVRGEGTSQATVDCAFALMEKLGKRPIRVQKEVPGFVANRLQIALFREALALYRAGVAGVEDIDTAVKASFGFRLPTIGPFETADLGGLDVWLGVSENLMPQIDRSTEPPPILRDKVKDGKLGAKTGEGFYKYDQATLEAKIKERDRQFLQRLKLLYLDRA